MYPFNPPELDIFAKENEIILPALDSLRGQALALMAQPEIRGQYYLGREEAKQFFLQVNMKTDDAIQPFNKALGLKRIPRKGFYCLEYPFVCDKKKEYFQLQRYK